MLDIFDSLLTIFQFFIVKVALFIWKVLLNNTFSDNSLVFFVHTETWCIWIVIWPLVTSVCHNFPLDCFYANIPHDSLVLSSCGVQATARVCNGKRIEVSLFLYRLPRENVLEELRSSRVFHHHLFDLLVCHGPLVAVWEEWWAPMVATAIFVRTITKWLIASSSWARWAPVVAQWTPLLEVTWFVFLIFSLDVVNFDDVCCSYIIRILNGVLVISTDL